MGDKHIFTSKPYPLSSLLDEIGKVKNRDVHIFQLAD